MHCSDALLTSLPPKRCVMFTLDGTRYQALVTLHTANASLAPVR